jgi:Starch-binding associating with outer membrane
MIMKKLLIACLGIFYLASCTNQLRIEQKQMAEDVTYGTSAKYLLSGSINGIGQFYQNAGFSEDRYNAIAQYYQQLFSSKPQTYDDFNQAPDSWDTQLLLLKPVEAGITLAIDEKEPYIQAALLVMKSFMFAHITDTWGDIPYSEALQGRAGIFFPKYDAQKDVYDGLFADLDAAIALFESGAVLKEPMFDLLYAGNAAKWVKFANSLKVRLLVRSYEAYKKSGVDNGAKLAAIVGGGKYFTSVSDNASYNYIGTGSFNSWPFGKSFNDQSGDNLTRRKPAVTFVNTLKSLNDPRLTGWIAPALIPWASVESQSTVVDRYGYSYNVHQEAVSDTTGKGISLDGYPTGSLYIGMICGKISGNPVRYGGTSAPFPAAGAYDNFRVSSFTQLFREDHAALLPITLLQACEVNLCLAEAAKKGWISGNASTYYNSGITLNMQRWLITDGEIADYLANPDVSLNGSGDLEKIATQKWLALFTVGVEGYLDFRRTRLPASRDAAMPALIVDKFPLRWRYPTPEISNNAAKVAEAVARQGADDQFTKMWLLK